MSESVSEKVELGEVLELERRRIEMLARDEAERTESNRRLEAFRERDLADRIEDSRRRSRDFRLHARMEVAAELIHATGATLGGSTKHALVAQVLELERLLSEGLESVG